MNPSNIRTGVTAEEIKQAFLDTMHCALGRSESGATKQNVYSALALTVRDRLFDRTVGTIGKYGGANARRVGYLSAEYLPGPQLANNLLSLGITEATREAMHSLGHDLDEIIAEEEEPGLGNGGLGRLASCYMDSLASVEVPAIGYGIRYEFGIFDQVIRDGWQEEVTDKWLRQGNAWEIARPGINYQVKFGGRTESSFDAQGHFRTRWIPETEVNGVAYDTPVLGYAVDTCDALRLWKAEAVESFDFASFNHGDYYRAVQDKMESENITKVLYPNDEVAVGKELRLKQQYFFSSCSLQDMLRIHAMLGGTPSNFHEKWAVQLNDTHPAVAVAELMRLLVDEHLLGWDEAWEITQKTFAYTN
ncbi:MAG TPA: glycogen/starch/alpha-glucan phosphorylase, partial [Chthoniobacterales bacterium]|nr:glycogen/starch/alpha-glucan phosphorylase [Chthoniobacterales bacterium]